MSIDPTLDMKLIEVLQRMLHEDCEFMQLGGQAEDCDEGYEIVITRGPRTPAMLSAAVEPIAEVLAADPNLRIGRSDSGCDPAEIEAARAAVRKGTAS